MSTPNTEKNPDQSDEGGVASGLVALGLGSIALVGVIIILHFTGLLFWYIGLVGIGLTVYGLWILVARSLRQKQTPDEHPPRKGTVDVDSEH